MNYDKKKLYISSSALVLASVLVCFIGSVIPRRFAASGAAVIFCILLLLFIKKRGELSIAKGQIAWFLPTIALFAVAVVYLSGIKFGFAQRGVDVSVIWYSVIPITVTVVASELTRSVLLMQENKYITAASFVFTAAFEIAVLAEKSPLSSFTNFTAVIGMTVLPALASSVLYTHISKRYGALPVILYRAVLALYGKLIPIYPKIPDSLMAFAKIIFPFLVLGFIRLLYERRKLAVSRTKFSLKTVGVALSIIIMTLFVMLISCRFNYGMLVVATESMTGSIDVGDAIIYEDYDGEKIEEGQVAVFEKDGTTYIHRIVKIEHINGEIRYYTKGDANDANDAGHITEKNIVGLTDITIKYAGYPTLWMREIFN